MRKVVMLNKDTLNLEMAYDSITECAKDLCVKPQHVFRVVNHERKTLHDKILLYAEEYLLMKKKDLRKKYNK